MTKTSSQEQSPSLNLDNIKMRSVEDLFKYNELQRLIDAHQQGDDSFQREFLPNLWLAYQKHFPNQLAELCRQQSVEKNLSNQQILDKSLPTNWDWTNLSRCIEPKLNILKNLHDQVEKQNKFSNPALTTPNY